MMNPRTITPATDREILALQATAALERAAESLVRCLERHAAAHGLTDAKLELLATLDCCAGGCAGLCSLGDSMGVSRPNVTKLVDGLERAGMVERTPHPTDRRRVQAQLTEAGAEVVAAAAPGREECRAGMWDALSEDELAELLVLLGKAGVSVGPASLAG